MKVRTLIWALEQRMAQGDLTGEEEVLFLDGDEADFDISEDDNPRTVRMCSTGDI